MRRTFLKIFSVFLIGLALYPSIFSALTIVQEKFNRWEMMERLEEQSLHSLIITQSDSYQWVDDKNEIRINGKMFDVKEFHYDNEDLVVTGLFDSEEDALEKVVSDLMNAQENRHQTASNSFLLSTLFNDFNKIQVTELELFPKAFDFPEPSYQLLSVSLDKVSPPPRQV